MTTHSTFREHSPNFIGVSDVGFGRDYAVFLSTESRVYFNKFGSGHEMVELVTPKVKLVPIL
jgi:ribosomal protein L27